MADRVRFEDLLGRVIYNSHGRPIGRIEDARMEPEGEEYLITHFMVGPVGRLRRFRAFLGELPTLRTLGLGSERDLRPFPWEWFDLSNPERPVLTVEASSA